MIKYIVTQAKPPFRVCAFFEDDERTTLFDGTGNLEDSQKFLDELMRKIK